MTKIRSSKKSDLRASYKINDAEFVIPSEAGMNLESSAKKIYKEQNEMKFYQRFFFGLAGLPFQAYFCAIGVFTTVYLLNKAGLPPEKTTYILFTSRIIDAITDPIYGYLVEKSRVTRFGKMKPWIAVSIPLSAISYVMMWYAPPTFSETQLFVWFIFWHSAQFTFITGFRIPHTAMTMYLSHSLKERENLTILRMASEMVGLLVALGIQGPLVANDSSCLKKNASGEIIPNQDSESNNNWEQFKYTYIAIIMTVIFFIGTIPLIIFVNEKPELINASAETQNVAERVSFWISLKRIFTFRPFIILIISTILSTSAIQILQANFQLYFDYSYVAISDKFTITIFVLLGCAILFVPIWKLLLTKFDKNKVFIVGNLLMVPLLIGIFFFSTNKTIEIVLFFVFVVIAANSFTCSFLVPWSMLPEVLDAFFIEYRSKQDALFYTFLALGTKVVIAFYYGISQVVLGLVKYESNVCAEFQNEKVAPSIKYLLAPTPLAFVILSSICIFFFPINSKLAKKNSELIKKIKQEGAKKDEIYKQIRF